MRSTAAVAISVAGVALLAACGQGASDRNASPDRRPTVTVTAPPSGPCPTSHPVALAVSTDDPDEVPYLDDVTACTDLGERSTYLANRADVVWTLAAAPGASVTWRTDSERGASFAGLVSAVHLGAVLLAGSAVVVDAPPATVRWTLHPGYSVAWLVHDQFADELADYGPEQLASALAGASLRRQAVGTCVLSLVDVVGDDLDELSGGAASERVLAALGIGSSTSTCARAWQSADDEALRRFGRTPTWGDDIARWIDDSRFVTTLDDQIPILRRIGRAFVLLV